MTTHHREPEHFDLVENEIKEFGLENIYYATYMYMKGLGGDIVEANVHPEGNTQGFRILIEYTSGFTLGVHYFGKHTLGGEPYLGFNNDGFLVYQHYSDVEFFVMPTFAAFCSNTMNLVTALQSRGLLGDDVARSQIEFTVEPKKTTH